MGLLKELTHFKRETREMNRKLDQIVELLKIIAEAQIKLLESNGWAEAEDDEPDTE